MTSSDLDRVGWGMIGAGRTGHTFASVLSRIPGAELAAAGAIPAEHALAFSDEFHITPHDGSVEAVLEDPAVDVVYIAVPHPFHADWTAKALEAGKAVLCEKPLTVNAAEARRVVAVARRTGKFLMEAMTTRFVPSMVRARELVEQGVLGEIRFVVADMGGRESSDPTARWSSPELGGGSLLEMGIYPVSFAQGLLGTPSRIQASAVMTSTGVDRSCTITLENESGAQAMLGCTLEAITASAACIAGTEARIEFDGRMNCPQGARLMVGKQIVEELPVIPHADRMYYEILETTRCVREGLLESPLLPLDETISIVETLDEIRRQIGVRYPFELPGEGPSVG